jgi:hypothetical protein
MSIKNPNKKYIAAASAALPRGPFSGDLVDRIIRYESEEIDQEEMVELFQDLIDSGMAWTLQGHYGRTAMGLIEAGIITAPVSHR